MLMHRQKEAVLACFVSSSVAGEREQRFKADERPVGGSSKTSFFFINSKTWPIQQGRKIFLKIVGPLRL